MCSGGAWSIFVLNNPDTKVFIQHWSTLLPWCQRGGVTWCLESCLAWFLAWCVLQVFTDCGDQTPKWLPSSPKWVIVGIMNYVLSLMETYLMKGNLLDELSLDGNILVEDINRMCLHMWHRYDKGIIVQRQGYDKVESYVKKRGVHTWVWRSKDPYSFHTMLF